MVDFSSERYIVSAGHRPILLVPAKNMPMERLSLTTLSYKPGALAIELNRSKASAGKELSLSRWCIASLYIYHFLTAKSLITINWHGKKL